MSLLSDMFGVPGQYICIWSPFTLQVQKTHKAKAKKNKKFVSHTFAKKAMCYVFFLLFLLLFFVLEN